MPHEKDDSHQDLDFETEPLSPQGSSLSSDSSLVLSVSPTPSSDDGLHFDSVSIAQREKRSEALYHSAADYASYAPKAGEPTETVAPILIGFRGHSDLHSGRYFKVSSAGLTSETDTITIYAPYSPQFSPAVESMFARNAVVSALVGNAMTPEQRLVFQKAVLATKDNAKFPEMQEYWKTEYIADICKSSNPLCAAQQVAEEIWLSKDLGTANADPDFDAQGGVWEALLTSDDGYLAGLSKQHIQDIGDHFKARIRDLGWDKAERPFHKPKTPVDIYKCHHSEVSSLLWLAEATGKFLFRGAETHMGRYQGPVFLGEHHILQEVDGLYTIAHRRADLPDFSGSEISKKWSTEGYSISYAGGVGEVRQYGSELEPPANRISGRDVATSSNQDVVGSPRFMSQMSLDRGGGLGL